MLRREQRAASSQSRRENGEGLRQPAEAYLVRPLTLRPQAQKRRQMHSEALTTRPVCSAQRAAPGRGRRKTLDVRCANPASFVRARCSCRRRRGFASSDILSTQGLNDTIPRVHCQVRRKTHAVPAARTHIATWYSTPSSRTPCSRPLPRQAQSICVEPSLRPPIALAPLCMCVYTCVCVWVCVCVQHRISQ